MTHGFPIEHFFSPASLLLEWRRIGCPKRSSLKNWKGQDAGEDPGKDGKLK
jgi:hypothetical protein